MGRTDDPVGMYLREMGNVELLSREGEIAIAKRIEAGREMMIGGICDSPLTMRAVVRWYEALVEGRMLLRDIIDLEAMYDDAYRTTTQELELKSCRYDEADFLYVHQLLSRKIADGKDVDDGLLQTII